MTGDEVVIAELREARQLAAELREMGVRDTSDWRRGYTAGCILTAKHNMGADPILCAAVLNETRFLMNRYLLRREA